MDNGQAERRDAEQEAEDAGRRTGPDPNRSTVGTGGPQAEGVKADPSGIDDPANVNPYQAIPGRRETGLQEPER